MAVELRDAELVAGGSPVLQNDTGTVRLEDARLGRVGPPASSIALAALRTAAIRVPLMAAATEVMRFPSEVCEDIPEN